MTERLARAARRPARVRRRRVAPAAHAAHRPAAAARGGAREHGRRTQRRSELDAGAGRGRPPVARSIDELLVLSRAGERDAPRRGGRPRGAAADAAPPLGARRRRARDRADARRRRAPAACSRCTRRPRPRVDALVENAIALRAARRRRAVVRADGAAIEVLDDGPGLAPGEEDEVFGRFHRGRAGRAGAPGTGLGLPIARELMRALGRRRHARQPAGGRCPRHAHRPALCRLFAARLLRWSRCVNGCSGSGSAC